MQQNKNKNGFRKYNPYCKISAMFSLIALMEIDAKIKFPTNGVWVQSNISHHFHNLNRNL